MSRRTVMLRSDGEVTTHEEGADGALIIGEGVVTIMARDPLGREWVSLYTTPALAKAMAETIIEECS